MNGAEILFPKPLPDETAYNLICRFHLLAGHSSFRGHTLPLLRAGSSRPANEFPSFLPQLSELSSIDIDWLVSNLTTIHYYEPFLSNEDYLFARQALKSGNTYSLQTKLGMIANRITSGKSLKLCPKCVQVDSSQYGIAYWHKTHQLVGVTACPVHDCHLQALQLASIVAQLPKPNRATELGINEECELSRLIADEFLDHSADIMKGEINQHYMKRISELGLSTQNGRIRQKQLKSFLLEKLSLLSQHSKVFQFLKNQTLSDCYPECLFYCPHSRHQPIKHFFLIYALFENWQLFRKSIEIPDSNQHNRLISEREKTQKLKIDWNKAILMLKNGASLRSVAPQFSTTISTLKIKAQQNGVKIDVRPSKIFNAEERAIWRKLFVGIKTKVIASEFGISVAAIEKILTKHPKLKILRQRIWYHSDFVHHKEKILGFIRNNLATTRNQIKNSEGASYIWLYKHERQWLYTHIPKEIPRQLRTKRSATITLT